MRAVTEARGGTRRLAGCGVLAALLVILWAPAALAEEPAPERDKREVAARQAFAVGKYKEALEIYGNLFAETAHPTYLRNIGRCYQNLGEPERAISSFREYLRQGKDLPADQRAVVEGYIREMEDLKKKREAESNGQTLTAQPASRPRSRRARRRLRRLPRRTGRHFHERGLRTATVRARRRPRQARLGGDVVGGVGIAGWAPGRSSDYARSRTERRRQIRFARWSRCTGDGYSKNEAAVEDARITDIALGVGVVGLGVAALLLPAVAGRRRPQSAPTAALPCMPELGPGLQRGCRPRARW